MLGWRYKDTDPSKFIGWGYQNPINSVTLIISTVTWTGFGTHVFFSSKHHERILCPDEFPRMRIRLTDNLRPREWSILRYLLSQFPNGHLFEAFYKRISLCLLNEKYLNWRTWRTLYPTLERHVLVLYLCILCRGITYFSSVFSKRLMHDVNYTRQWTYIFYWVKFLLRNLFPLIPLVKKWFQIQARKFNFLGFVGVRLLAFEKRTYF